VRLLHVAFVRIKNAIETDAQGFSFPCDGSHMRDPGEPRRTIRTRTMKNNITLLF
jgi:hypothetical protein